MLKAILAYRYASRHFFYLLNIHMYYQPQEMLTPKQCNHILKRLRRAEWIRGWTRSGVAEWRTDSVAWYEAEQYGKMLYHWRRFLSSTAELPVDWIQTPYQVSRFEPGNLHEWHRHDRGDRTENLSSNSVSLICNLQTAPGAWTETDSGEFDLPAGWGIVFPATDRIRHTAPVSGTRILITVWSMRYNPRPR